MLAFALAIGNHFIAADHNGSSRKQVLSNGLTHRLLGSPFADSVSQAVLDVERPPFRMRARNVLVHGVPAYASRHWLR